MSWNNADGLFVKFQNEEASAVKGGIPSNIDGQYTVEAVVAFSDVLSATAVILGDATLAPPGAFGVMVPKGLFVEEIELITETAFTSSGTIASATWVMGLIREDRTTAYSANGFTTTALTGAAFAAAGTKTVIRVGSTGVGALVGTALANDGLIVIANSTHATNPFTAGQMRVRVRGYYQ